MVNFTQVAVASKTLVQNVEFSIAKNANYSSGSPMTTAGYVTASIDLRTMVAGDVVEIRCYQAVNGGTADLIFGVPATLMGTQSGLYRIRIDLIASSWDITAKLTTATGRAMNFEVWQDTNDVNVATISASAITAAAIATDAIDADAIKTDAVTELQSGLATSTALATAQTDLTTLTGRLTSGRASNLDSLDTTVSSRSSAAALVTAQTDLTTLTGRLTSGRAINLDNLDTTVTSRAPASTAVSTAVLTPTRQASLDNLDATVSSRAPSATALSTAVWTNGLAALISNLDATVSSRATSSALSAVSTLVVALGTALADVQARIPAALDGAGNIKAGVQTLAAGALTAVADAIFGFVVNSGAASGARTFAEQWRIRHGIMVGSATGLTPPAIATTEIFLQGADGSKPVATFAIGTNGTRTAGTLDGTP